MYCSVECRRAHAGHGHDAACGVGSRGSGSGGGGDGGEGGGGRVGGGASGGDWGSGGGEGSGGGDGDSETTAGATGVVISDYDYAGAAATTATAAAAAAASFRRHAGHHDNLLLMTEIVGRIAAGLARGEDWAGATLAFRGIVGAPWWQVSSEVGRCRLALCNLC
jgi:hypothetical protein